jgi:hypothetical protein
MMAGYWFKVYVEILDDPKYFRWSDNSKIGCFELMVIAKKVQVGPQATGELPSIEDICFYSRRDQNWWEPVIEELLTKTNPRDKKDKPFLIRDGEILIIRKFKDRQKAVDSAERSREYRKRKAQAPESESDESQNEEITDSSRIVIESKSKSKSKSKRERESKEEEVGGNIEPVTEELILFFENCSKIKRPKSQEELGKWILSLSEIMKAGANREIINLACKELTEKNYLITGPWSIKKPVEVIMSRRSRRDNPLRNSEGDFGEFMKH